MCMCERHEPVPVQRHLRNLPASRAAASSVDEACFTMGNASRCVTHTSEITGSPGKRTGGHCALPGAGTAEPRPPSIQSRQRLWMAAGHAAGPSAEEPGAVAAAAGVTTAAMSTSAAPPAAHAPSTAEAPGAGGAASAAACGQRPSPPCATRPAPRQLIPGCRLQQGRSLNQMHARHSH